MGRTEPIGLLVEQWLNNHHTSDCAGLAGPHCPKIMFILPQRERGKEGRERGRRLETEGGERGGERECV